MIEIVKLGYSEEEIREKYNNTEDIVGQLYKSIGSMRKFNNFSN